MWTVTCFFFTFPIQNLVVYSFIFLLTVFYITKFNLRRISSESMQNIKRRENYRIAGNFRGRKPSRIGEKCDFRGENFRRLLAFAAPKDATLSNFAEKMKSLGWHIVSEYQVELGKHISSQYV